jgi:ABC-type antimicrobial peptide transport system permease subunit
MLQDPQWELEIAVRSKGHPTALSAGIISAVSDTDRDISVSNIQTMDDRLASQVAQRKAIMTLMSALAGLAIVLSTVGIGGVFAYIVSQRTREMGIRLALGASRANMVRLIVSEASTVINLGGLLGLFAAMVFSRFIASMLVGVGEHDPAVIAGAFALTTVFAISAAILPAIRASRTDVLSVLRDE